MTDPENFLERWSKRKLANDEPAAPEQEKTPPHPAKDSVAEAPAAGADASAAAPEGKTIDLASLPPIESIGANTDVTAFLRPGVPPELTRAALRRAWSTDPAIRDFVGLVENGWDFNDPQAMPGFGPIDASEVARLVAQAIGELPTPPAESPAEAAKQPTLGQSESQQSKPVTAVQSDQPETKPDDAGADGADVHRNRKNDASQKFRTAE